MKRILIAAVLCASIAPVQAQGPSADSEVRNLITCYPFGIDRIGKGEQEAGVAIWKGCFAADFAFSLFIGRGAPVECPGPSCPFPKEMSAIDMRAAFAPRAFDGSGFVKTSC